MSEAHFSIGNIKIWVGARFERIRAFHHLIVDDWKRILKQSYAIRTTAFWALLGGLLVVLPLISEEAKALIGPWTFAALFLGLFVTVAVARVMKQPGTDGEG